MTPRDDYFIPDGIYLLSHALGLLPKSAQINSDEFFHSWQEKGVDAWEKWFAIIHEFCGTLAQLLNTSADAICPQVNISSALVKIIYSLPTRKSRNKIVLTELDFPSQSFVCQQAQKLGYQIEFIKPVNHQFPIELWEKTLKPDVQFAFITHVLSGNSYQNPVAKITQLCRKQGIFSIVDIAQSVGVIPINLQEWCADFVIGSSVKWLCGGPGAAFLCVNRKRIDEFCPVDVGWFSHDNPFEMDIHHFQYAPNALRFLGGTPSVLPLYIATASIKKILSQGIQQIYQHNQHLLDALYASALENRLTINSPAERSLRGGTLVIQLAEAEKALQFLKHQQIMIDVRPEFGARFSPHLYNTVGEIKQVITSFEALSSF